MAEASDVVRTRRLEVVDDEGRLRVVAGLIHRDEITTVYGIVVRDQNGRDRLWSYDYLDGGAEVAVDWGGNTVASLGVSDTGEPYLFLAEEEYPGA